jgi:Ca2+/Na+ antiporter
MWCVQRSIKTHLKWSQSLVGQAFLVCVAVVLVFSGCKKQEEEKTQPAEKKPAPVLPSVYADRVNDKAYIDSLMANRKQQAKEARERLSLSLKMTQCVTRVRGTLPPEATGEAVQKALVADPAWKDLESQIKKAEAVAAETLKQAQELVRKRMKDELRDNQAISKGEAKAIDNVLPADKK